MHTPLSIIFFTVLSGTGLGISTILGIFSNEFSDNTVLISVVFSFGFVVTGLSASVLHLANPKNAWRSFMRVRTSWLSREAVAVVLYMLVLGIWFLNKESVFLGALLSIVSLITVYCTAMIYQSIKPIAQWNHPLTSLNYISFSLLAACLWCVIFNQFDDGNTIKSIQILLFITLFFAFYSKICHYRRIDKLVDTTTAHAVGFSQAQARLLDAGHSGPTFLTKEFINKSAHNITMLRIASTTVFTLASLLIGANIFNVGINILLVIIVMGAILIERWLFFREAKHTIRAFH